MGKVTTGEEQDADRFRLFALQDLLARGVHAYGARHEADGLPDAQRIGSKGLLQVCLELGHLVHVNGHDQLTELRPHRVIALQFGSRAIVRK